MSSQLCTVSGTVSRTVSRTVPPIVLRAGMVLASFALLVPAGCGRTPTVDDRVKNAVQGTTLTPNKLSPLGGRVLYDGEPPKVTKGHRLIVMATTKGDLEPNMGSRPYVIPDKEGKFAFTSQRVNDGLPNGKYIIIIAELGYRKKTGYSGPDVLKNMYNDPDKNANDPRFVIDHAPPGKTDYTFDLKVQGQEGVADPGPHALTKFEE